MTRVRAGVTACTCFVVVGALLGSDAEPQVLVLTGIVCLASAVLFISLDLLRAASSVAWAQAPKPYAVGVGDDAVMAVADQIRGSRRSASLLDTVIALADQRLLDHHGIDRTAQPAAADELLGPGLTELIQRRGRRPVKAADVTTLLDEIESI